MNEHDAGRPGHGRRSRPVEPGDALRAWARDLDLTRGVDWGMVEARIAAEPAPTQQYLDTEFPPRRARHLFAYLPLGLAALALPATPGWLLLVAWLRVNGTWAAPTAWQEPFHLGLGVAAVAASATPMLIWRSTRRRGLFALVFLAACALCLGVAAWLLSTTTIAVSSSLGTTMWLAVAGASVAGLSLVVMGLAGTPTVRAPLRQRLRMIWPGTTQHERFQRGLRAIVLEQFKKRGAVNDADSTALCSLPSGTWSQVHTLPDGRVTWASRT